MSAVSVTKKKPDSSGGWKKITTIEKIRTASDGTVTRTIRTITETKGPGSGNSTGSDSESDGLSGGVKRITVTGDPKKDVQHGPTLHKKATSPKQERKGLKTSDGSGSDSDDDDQFAEECLAVHNRYRAKHGVQLLKMSKEINKYAKEWACKIARDDMLSHRPNCNYGENVYGMWSSDRKHKIKGTEPVDKWYSEIKDHRFGQEPTTLNTGHFTQVVWKSSQQMGVAKKRSKTGKIFVVANYEPAGNFVAQFKENVLPPQ